MTLRPSKRSPPRRTRSTFETREGGATDGMSAGKSARIGVSAGLRAFYNWAVRHDHVPASPFMKQHLTVVQMYGELPRDRRLLEGEEAKILAAAPPRIRDLVIAALETGCRMGELSGLQWFQVRWDLNEIHLRLIATKGKKPRALPMSQRLRAVLELRRHAPAGEPHPPRAFVFGNEVGEQIKDPKKAWPRRSFARTATKSSIPRPAR